jgi:hypothetical protein
MGPVLTNPPYVGFLNINVQSFPAKRNGVTKHSSPGSPLPSPKPLSRSHSWGSLPDLARARVSLLRNRAKNRAKKVVYGWFTRFTDLAGN